MIIKTFTIHEINYFRQHCDFTEDEKFVFEERLKETKFEDIKNELLINNGQRLANIYISVNEKIRKAIKNLKESENE